MPTPVSTREEAKLPAAHRRRPWLVGSIASAAILLFALGFAFWRPAKTDERIPEPILAVASEPKPILPLRSETPSPSRHDEIPPAKNDPSRSEPPLAVIPKVEPIEPKAKESKNPKLISQVVPEKEEKKVLLPVKPEPERKEPERKGGTGFDQELAVTQKPTFRILGTATSSLLAYRIVSRFEPGQRQADGTVLVEQSVREARLLEADDLTRGLLAAGVAQLPGTRFVWRIDAKGDVSKAEGAGGKIQAVAKGGAGGANLQLASLLDEDGWREMAQIALLKVDPTVPLGQQWARPMTHRWGPLGQWRGQVRYVVDAKKGDMKKVSYALQVAYRPPDAAANGLGFRVVGADFRTPLAAGTILYDAKLDRVAAAEEVFRVVGGMQMDVLGLATAVEIEEEQHFRMTIR